MDLCGRWRKTRRRSHRQNMAEIVEEKLESTFLKRNRRRFSFRGDLESDHVFRQQVPEIGYRRTRAIQAERVRIELQRIDPEIDWLAPFGID